MKTKKQPFTLYSLLGVLLIIFRLKFQKSLFDLDKAVHRSQRQLRTFQSSTIPSNGVGLGSADLRVGAECLTVRKIVVEYLAYSVGEMWPPGALGMPALPL